MSLVVLRIRVGVPAIAYQINSFEIPALIRMSVDIRRAASQTSFIRLTSHISSVVNESVDQVELLTILILVTTDNNNVQHHRRMSYDYGWIFTCYKICFRHQTKFVCEK